MSLSSNSIAGRRFRTGFVVLLSRILEQWLNLQKTALPSLNAMPDESLRHRLSNLFLGASGPYRKYLALLATQQVSIEDMPGFRKFVLRFAFVAVAERTIEGDRARVHTRAMQSRRASGPVVSTTLRGNEIQSLFAKPANFKDLARHLDTVTNGKHILSEHNLLYHPDLRGVVRPTFGTVWPIIYHCDVQQEYMKQTAYFTRIRHVQDESRRAANQAVLCATVPPSSRDDAALLAYQDAATQHFRMQVAPCCFYSILNPADPSW